MELTNPELMQTPTSTGQNETTGGSVRTALKFILGVSLSLAVFPGCFLWQWLLQTTPAERRAADEVRKLGGAVDTRTDHTFQVTSVAFDLAEQRFGDEQFENILDDLQSFRALETLSLRKTAVTDASMPGLARLTDLKTLSLQRTDITDAGLAPLGQLVNLEHLILVQTRISDDGLKYLTGLPKLRTLLLSKNDLTDESAEHLKKITTLRELYLGFTKLTDDGLAELKTLKNLEVISLQWTDVTDAGLKGLKNFKKLRDLSVFEAKVTDEAITDLRREMPKLQIISGHMP